MSFPTAVDEELPANTQTTEPARVAVAVAVPEWEAMAVAESWSLAVAVAVPELSAVAVAVLLSPAVDVVVPEVVEVEVAVLPPSSAVAEAAVPPPAIEEVHLSPLPSGPRVSFPVQPKIGITAPAVPTRLPKHNKMENANNTGEKKPLLKYFIASPTARFKLKLPGGGRFAQTLTNVRPIAYF